MNKKIIWNVNMNYGQLLAKGTTKEKVKKYLQKEYGSSGGPYYIKEATEDDIAWVKYMNGIIHEVD